jgi:hypothetical protein
MVGADSIDEKAMVPVAPWVVPLELAKDRTNRGIDIVMFRVSKRRET